MKSIFFTSDFHIGHKKVLEYDERPFKDLNHMNRVLINNYNNTVKEDSVCYFLGDMGLCNQNYLHSVISQLNGTKVLILGNHDRKMEAMYKAGFDVVMYNATLYIANERVTLSHCPLKGVFREDTTKMRNYVEGENWHGEFRHHKYTVADEGQYHLHGHTHCKPETKIMGKQFDVGVVANNYFPVHIGQIEKWAVFHKNRKNDITK